MSETVTQANHELLLGMSKDMKIITDAMETFSRQLLELTMTIGPALGMCGSCAEEWIEAGEDPESPIAAAVTVVIAEGIGMVPVCMWHFRESFKARASAQISPAQETGGDDLREPLGPHVR